MTQADHLDRPARRRDILFGGLALAGAGMVAAMPRPSHAAAKLPQKAVQYQDHPKNGQLCARCVAWRPPNQCALVMGTISAAGWCNIFSPKG